MEPLAFDRRALDAGGDEAVLDIARAMAGAPLSAESWDRIAAVSADVLHGLRFGTRTCGLALRDALARLSELRDPGGALTEKVGEILAAAAPSLPERFTHGRFVVRYAVDGPGAVDTAAYGETVFEPATSSPIGTLPRGSAPEYVRRVGFWAEYALTKYAGADFGMPEPSVAGGSLIQVDIRPTMGEPGPASFAVAPRFNPGRLAAWVAHEVFHLTQFAFPAVHERYRALLRTGARPGDAGWMWDLLEGGAVFAEDAVTTLLHRYLLEASSFYGMGPLAAPAVSLQGSRYRTGLFWRYLAERADTSDAHEARWRVYRDLLGHLGNRFTSPALDEAISRVLPGSRLLTTVADFGAACALAARPVDGVDGELVFGQSGAEILYQQALGENETPVLLTQLLPSIAVTAVPLVMPDGIEFSGRLAVFAHHVFELAATTPVDVRLEAMSGLGDVTFQLLEIRMHGDRGQLVGRRTCSGPLARWHVDQRGSARLVFVVTAGAEDGAFRARVSPAVSDSGPVDRGTATMY